MQRERRGRKDAEVDGDERSLGQWIENKSSAVLTGRLLPESSGTFTMPQWSAVQRFSSTIGKTPIPIPPNVTLTPIRTSLAVKGPLGSTSVGVHSAHPLG